MNIKETKNVNPSQFQQDIKQFYTTLKRQQIHLQQKRKNHLPPWWRQQMGEDGCSLFILFYLLFIFA